jgi:tetratricopeptide (TPR) repeat protein
LTTVLCAALLSAGSARAAGVDPANATAVEREQAQAHFLKGKTAFESNDMTTALEQFRASLEIVASPNARLYVARTLRELGRLVEAYEEFGRTAAEAKEHEREDGRYGKAAQAALAERASIAPQIAFVKLTIKDANDATTVNVQGSPLVRAGWTDPVPVKPGDVEIEVVTPGVLPIRKTVSVRAGKQMPLEVDAMAPGGGALGGTGGPPGPTVATAPETSDAHAGRHWMLPAAIAGAGVGVLGMIIFTAAGVASNNTYSDLQKQCGAGPCPASLSGEVSRGKTEQAVANTGLVFGILGLAAGAALFTLWVLPHKHASASASLLVGPGSLGLAGTF